MIKINTSTNQISLIVFTLIGQLILTNQNLIAQEFKVSPKPDWVEEVELSDKSEVARYDVNGGYYTRLYDYQINLNNEADFYHTRQKVISTAGVSAISEFYIQFDSTYQQVELHYLYIWRDGKKIDKTNDLSIEFLSNEENLQQKIYNGKLTAFDVLEDIRKGDELEYAYTVYGDNPIFDDNNQRLIPIADINPIDAFFLKVISPKEKKMRFKFKGVADSLYTVSESGNDQIIKFWQTNIKETELEETTPSWILPYNYFNLSVFQDWEYVTNWALKVFELEEEPDFKEVFEELFTGEETRDEKINKIIDFVQDDIRYMGIESGIGSIKPFTPNQVLKQRFGDCKDKSLLFVKLMNKIGINEAYPVLVNTDFNKGVDSILEAGQNFNHCIATYFVDNKQYWIDPTSQLQGGNYKTLTNFDYGKALIIKPGNKSLSDFNIKDTISGSKIIELLDVTSYTEPGTLKVTTTLSGSVADYIRSIIEYYSAKEISESYKEQYSLLYPNIFENEKLIINDDIDKNEIEFVENYIIKDHWIGDNPEYEGKWVVNYEPVSLYNYISHVSCEEKDFPVQYAFPNQFEQYTTINLPAKMTLDNDILEKNNAAFDFRKEYELVNDTQIYIQYKYLSKSLEISPEEYQDVCSDMNEIARNLRLTLYYPKFNYMQSEEFQELFKSLSKKAKKSKRKKKKEKNNIEDSEIEEEIIPITTTTTYTYNADKSSGENEPIFTIVEEMPIFKGGNDSMYVYINNQINYPEWEFKEKIEGTVYVSFVVNKFGKTQNVKVLKTVANSKNFDKESIRIIEEMPKWTPGKQAGETVSVQYTIPISFKLDE